MAVGAELAPPKGTDVEARFRRERAATAIRTRGRKARALETPAVSKRRVGSPNQADSLGRGPDGHTEVQAARHADLSRVSSPRRAYKAECTLTLMQLAETRAQVALDTAVF